MTIEGRGGFLEYMELLCVFIVVTVATRLLPKLAELYIEKGAFYCNRPYLNKKLEKTATREEKCP